MTTKLSESITIAAPPEAILAVLRDIATMPSWSSVHIRTEVIQTDDAGLPRAARMSVSSAGITDVQVLEYSWRDDGVSWSLRESTTQRSQRGSYQLTAVGDRTRVDYRVDVDLKLPLPGFVLKKGLKGVVAAATVGLKARVERR